MAFVTRKFAETGNVRNADRYYIPVAPGALDSPQEPGELPDRSSVPERGVLPVPPPVGEVRRPLTQYGTSEEIMDVYRKPDLEPTDPARFEQAPPSYEEQRKANPALLKPLRPQPGYALSGGTRLASPELAAIAAKAAEDLPLAPGE